MTAPSHKPPHVRTINWTTTNTSESGEAGWSTRGSSQPGWQARAVDVEMTGGSLRGSIHALASVAAEVVVLADHTKIGAEALLQTVAAEDIQHVVTDDASEAAELDALRELGITVHVATVAS